MSCETDGGTFVINRTEVEAIIRAAISPGTDEDPAALAQRIVDTLEFAGYKIVKVVSPA